MDTKPTGNADAKRKPDRGIFFGRQGRHFTAGVQSSHQLFEKFYKISPFNSNG